MYPPPELIGRSFHFFQLNRGPLPMPRRSNDCWFSRPTPVRSPAILSATSHWWHHGQIGCGACRVATRFTALTHMSFRMNYNSINVLGNLRAYIMLPNWADQLLRPRCWFMGNDEVALPLDKGWRDSVAFLNLPLFFSLQYIFFNIRRTWPLSSSFEMNIPFLRWFPLTFNSHVQSSGYWFFW